ncbi:dipeptide epimerase [Clostridium sp. SYSU_GA19001]|uniref:dipeptide epimerase n=1 Tax=Clostridium caldaquaticum TaxID=2940653 RepID=UPI00207733B2|nr:dipeptide epimerase [Clostridium caldaquaticum]MCM8710697.1 dipeptide epimerase [Clostridium caldaquaticum]
MKIADIKVGKVSIALKKTFKTALRTVDRAEEIVIKVISDSGEAGFGSATPTAVITGEIESSIEGAVKGIIKPKLIGMDIDNMEGIMNVLHSSIIKNTSAKAAVDMAVYDLFGKKYNMPLYKLFGGYRNEITTDITISVNSLEEMVNDSIKAVQQGFNILKIKAGTDFSMDIQRIKAIRDAVGGNITIRVDANQGWKPKEAVRIIRKFEDMGLNIELVEQPVKYWDLEGLKFVTENVETDILADEAVFSSYEALKVIQMRAADLVNIKLMKCGGLYNAAKINSIAETMGIECMIGCMLESKIGITAAASFSGGKKNITRADLDTVNLMLEDPVIGGVSFNKDKILLSDAPGLGITDVQGWVELS